MNKQSKYILIGILLWLCTHVFFFYYYSDRLMFDEVNYLYEVKLLSDHTPVFFSQGPVMYYAVLPFFQLFHSVVSMKLSILLLDFIVLVVLFFALKRYDESLANGVSLFYILSHN